MPGMGGKAAKPVARPTDSIAGAMMAGNSRSGRRPEQVKEARQGTPQRPAKLTADEAWFWDQVIATAEHLEAMDSPLCQAATRAWGLYCRVCVLAAKDPTDKEIKGAVSTYGTLLDKLCARIAVDPLGRARHKPKRAVELDPLAQFLAGGTPRLPMQRRKRRATKAAAKPKPKPKRKGKK